MANLDHVRCDPGSGVYATPRRHDLTLTVILGIADTQHSCPLKTLKSFDQVRLFEGMTL